jgi:phage terminase large subunit GpA-like protein
MKGCNSCQVISINGVATHETGCINSNINPATGKRYTQECKWCGQEFIPEIGNTHGCCDNECAEAYYG